MLSRARGLKLAMFHPGPRCERKACSTTGRTFPSDTIVWSHPRCRSSPEAARHPLPLGEEIPRTLCGLCALEPPQKGAITPSPSPIRWERVAARPGEGRFMGSLDLRISDAHWGHEPNQSTVAAEVTRLRPEPVE